REVWAAQTVRCVRRAKQHFGAGAQANRWRGGALHLAGVHDAEILSQGEEHAECGIRQHAVGRRADEIEAASALAAGHNIAAGTRLAGAEAPTEGAKQGVTAEESLLRRMKTDRSGRQGRRCGHWW